MKGELEFSIVIPVYNSEKYVSNAIESIMKQEYEKWKLFLIDDGSTDNSYNICSKFAELDERIVVRRKINGGVSSARNLGIELAEGDYLVFCDSDDYYDNDFLQSLIEHLEYTSFPDIIVYGVYFGNGWMNIPYYTSFDKCFDKGYIMKNVLPGQIGLGPKDNKDILPFCYNKVYKLSIVKSNNIVFDEKLRKWEDKEFVINFLNFAQSISFINRAFYHYTSQDGEHLGIAYVPELISYIPLIYENRKQLFSDYWNLENDFTIKYYFDIMMNLIYEAIDKEEKQEMSRIVETLRSSIVCDWLKLIEPRFEGEKRFLKVLRFESCDLYYNELIKYRNARKRYDIRRKYKRKCFYYMNRLMGNNIIPIYTSKWM